MSEYVEKEKVLLALCEYCDSHVVGCGGCPIKAAIDKTPVIETIYGYSIENLVKIAMILKENGYKPEHLDRFLIGFANGVELGYKTFLEEMKRQQEKIMREITGGANDETDC